MTIATLFQDVEQAFRSSSGVFLNETEDAYLIEANVAGVKRENIEITFEKRALHIEAKTGGYSYSYLVPLPSMQIDESVAPVAVAENGILKVTFTKAKAAKPLKIEVLPGA